jgi:hypothetical protein
MGCWGPHSYDNDGTMDRLIVRDAFYEEGTGELNDEGLANAYKDISCWEDPGVTVYLVTKGAHVPEEHIHAALDCLRDCLRPGRMHTMELDETDLAALRSEIKLLERALEPTAPSNVLQDLATATTTTQAGACAACGSSSGASDAPLKRCSRCQSVKYCSALCQRTHWPAHKASCAAAAAAGSGGGASAAQAGGRAGTPAAEALLQAAEDGDVAEVRRLVAMGVNVKERDADHGTTALHVAAEFGQVVAIA